MESAPVLATQGVQQRGFTLVEMLVVLAIITILTSIIIVSQSTFNRSLLLTDTTYGIALSAREAQTFGLGSRQFGSISNAGYGLHFDIGNPKSYTVFADTDPSASGGAPSDCPLGDPDRPDHKPGDCRYTAGADGTVSTYTFTRGFYVKDICLREDNGTAHCSTDSTGSLRTLDVVFMRPNTATTMSGLLDSTFYPSMQVTSSQVTLSDPTGSTSKYICVSKFGQVVVSGNSCL